MREVLCASRELFEAWNQNNVVYCHWKSNEHLYEGLIGTTDLDILVKPDHQELAEECLRHLGFVKFHPQYGSRYQMVDDWITCDRQTGKLIHVHLHYKLLTGHKGMKEFDLPWTELALQSRGMHEEFPVYVADPNLEMITLLARIALKRTAYRAIRAKLGSFALSHSDQAEIAYLQLRIREDELKKIAEMFFERDAELLCKLVCDEKRDAGWFGELCKIMDKHLGKYDRYGFKSVFMKPYYYSRIMGRGFVKKKGRKLLITKKTPPKGFIVAFIGQDGAGKSTVTDEVKKWLNWKIDAEKFYLGSGEHYHSWQKTAKNLLKGKKGVAGKIKNLLVVSDLLKIARVTKKKVWQAEKYAGRGGIAIFDRYPQIQFEGINDGPKIRVNSANLKLPGILRSYVGGLADKEEKMIRKSTKIQPALVIKMTLPPEESIRRKPEETLETVAKKHEIIEKLDFPNSRVVTIDAAQDYQAELIQIHNEIWDWIRNNS